MVALRLVFVLVVLALARPVPAAEALVYPSAPRAERLAALDAFWAGWKRVYLREGCGGAYVDTSGDGKPTWGGSAADTLTVSEAQGYGMLALVQMAGRDAGARRLFDAMLAFFRAHPSASGPGLMAWNQTRDCRDSDPGATMSASDGDLDVAWALTLAERRWGGYGAEAARVRTAILAREVTPDGMIRLGDWATEGGYGAASRASDFMPASFAAFAAAGGAEAARWRQIRDRGYAVWGALARRHAAGTGLVPDFLVGLPDSPRPAPPLFLEGAGDGSFSWNALRYPWRLALDLQASGAPRARVQLLRINSWLRRATGGDPGRIASTYRLDGTIPEDQGAPSGAFIAMFASAALAGSGAPAADQAWADALWAALVALPLEREDYYGNTLKLLAMIALTGPQGPQGR